MLTTEQIGHLFDFCRKHYVNHYDVQVELVDHLANAVEAKMAADQSLGFETALEKVYTGFGRMGFSQLVKSRSYSLSAKYRKQRLDYFLSYFSWPKLGLTIFWLAIIIYTGRMISGEMRFYAIMGIQSILFCYDIYVGILMIRRLRTQQKAMVMTNAAMEEPFIVFLFFAFIFPGTYSEIHDTGMITYMLICAMVLVIFLLIRAFWETSVKVFNDARKEYPGAFTVSG